jgi:hypothetical protein
MDPFDETQAMQYLQRDSQYLYEQLVPEHLRAGSLYSREGLAARGKQIFTTVLAETKPTICSEYALRKDTVRNSVDLMTLVGSVLLVAHVAVPIMPMAALVVKIGMDELCRGYSPTKQTDAS